mmetsp:Transcript_3428/g.5706  ORF Transcript_3428/g.5706 Transcript_3428/m.5706 type:complete len:353 (-) Transcript_3428:145-1203(-)
MGALLSPEVIAACKNPRTAPFSLIACIPACGESTSDCIESVFTESVLDGGFRGPCAFDQARGVGVHYLTTEVTEDPVIIRTPARFKCDFVGLDWIPAGWTGLEDPPPDGFLYAGGSARVIEYRSERNVLVALQDWAVCLRQARLMSRCSSTQSMLKVRSVRCSAEESLVCAQFDCPHEGENLQVLLQEGRCFSEEFVQNMCKDLLDFALHLDGSLRLWGLLDSSMVWVYSHGRVSKVLPISCLLSVAGVKAVVSERSTRSIDTNIPPEIRKFASSRSEGEDIASQVSDTYAIASLGFRAMFGGNAEISSPDILDLLSSNAFDFFHKALYTDPIWRLSSVHAFEHPWLARDRV